MHVLSCNNPHPTHLWNSDSTSETPSLHVYEPRILQCVAVRREALSREHCMSPHL